MNDQTKKDLKELLEYMWEQEAQSFEECDCPDNHIFNVMMRLRDKVLSA